MLSCVPKDDYVEIYVDGSFYNGQYSGGYVVYKKGRIIYQDCGIGQDTHELLKMRNISGEMTACMRAVCWADSHMESALIIHDYTGLHKWVTGEWQTKNKYTEMYANYIRPFYYLGIIDFKWVRGHQGIEGNEIADRLAKQAIIFHQQWKF